MAKLIFLFDGNLLGEYELNKERITIGRRPSNDIHIDNLAVSGEHAVVVTLGDDSFLEDLNSTNGTFVNQKRVRKHVLQHQDVIELGKYQLKFLAEQQSQSPQNSGFVNTVFVQPEKESVNVAASATNVKVVASEPIAPEVASLKDKLTTDTKPAAPISAEQIRVSPERAKPKQASPLSSTEVTLGMGHIKVLNGENNGQELMLNKTMVRLGKQGVQLAVVTRRPNGYFITHVEGRGYPLINGNSIGVHAYALNSHDVIEILNEKMEFYLD